MHPEILSITLFGIVAAFTPGPNNFVAFYSGFNFGIKRTLPHILVLPLVSPFFYFV
jgi:threonine/homoserine/homoserine lactone efflux protein